MAVAEEALKVCETLEKILKGTFGPNGHDVMLNSSSGEILITNNGALILRSLNLENPIGRTIVNKIVSFSSISGDGATSFVLLLSSILREAVSITGMRDNFDPTETLSIHRGKTLPALSRAFYKLESSLLEHEVVVSVLNGIAVTTDLEAEDSSLIKQRMNRLLITTLNGKFPTSLVSNFVELLYQVVMETRELSAISLQDALLHVIDEFGQICVEVPGVPISSSHLKPGVIIPRGFSIEQQGVPKTSQEFMFVVMNCSFDFLGPQTSSSIQIKDETSLGLSVEWKRNQVKKVITMFNEHKIKLILSSENVPDFALHFCRQYGIAVVSSIPQEYVRYICKCTGILAINDVGEDNLSELFVGKGVSCDLHTIGHHRFVHLELDLSNCKFSPCSILLCSPVQGLCRQYYIVLHHALKCIKMSFSEDGKKLLFVPGAGACELALSFSLKKISNSVKDSNLSLALEILSSALRAIPRFLHQNSFSMSHPKENFIHCLNEMERSLKDDGLLLGIDSKTGKSVDPQECEIFEPLQGKHLLWQSVLQCTSQLLRTDKLIGVRKIDNGV